MNGESEDSKASNRSEPAQRHDWNLASARVSRQQRPPQGRGSGAAGASPKPERAEHRKPLETGGWNLRKPKA